jgi:hypothetical protein
VTPERAAAVLARWLVAVDGPDEEEEIARFDVACEAFERLGLLAPDDSARWRERARDRRAPPGLALPVAHLEAALAAARSGATAARERFFHALHALHDAGALSVAQVDEWIRRLDPTRPRGGGSMSGPDGALLALFAGSADTHDGLAVICAELYAAVAVVRFEYRGDGPPPAALLNGEPALLPPFWLEDGRGSGEWRFAPPSEAALRLEAGGRPFALAPA